MMRFAEERGQVRGQRVGERFPLVAIRLRFETIEVKAERIDIAGAQASRETAVRHVALMLGQRNPRATINQVANAAEIGAGEFEVAFHFRTVSGPVAGCIDGRARCHHLAFVLLERAWAAFRTGAAPRFFDNHTARLDAWFAHLSEMLPKERDVMGLHGRPTLL